MTSWWEDRTADWTQGRPGRFLDLLTAVFDDLADIRTVARAVGLDWYAAPSGSMPARTGWLWVLLRAAGAARILDLVAEILDHDRSVPHHAAIYQLLGDASFAVDARRALRHGLSMLPGNGDRFGESIRFAASAPSDTPVGSLEAITSPPSGLGDPKAYAQSIIDATRRIAMIEVAGRPRGTGLLVGPDLLLTAAHVLGPHRRPPVDAGEVVAVFDYLATPGRSAAETGTRVGVGEFLCESRPTDAEAAGRVLDWGAPPDRLDFALLRLASRVPEVPGALAPRGHYQLRPDPYAFDQATFLFIVQHPLGEFQAFSYIRQAPQRNDAGTRIRYRTNTLPGSSGSPVIDTLGRLVAIHHYSATGTNQAVPVSEIAKAILAGPHAHLLDGGSASGVAAPGWAAAEEELRRCVVSISDIAGSRWGTGFFVAPTTILTARHILTAPTVGARYNVSLGGCEFAAQVTAVPPELDLAVLEADRPTDFWLPLDRSPAVGDRLVGYGFAGGRPRGQLFAAEVRGTTDDGTARVLTYRTVRTTRGFGGAPLYDLDRRGVCGIVMVPDDARPDSGGRAVAAASVLELLPSIRALAWRLGPPGRQDDQTGLTTSEQIKSLAEEVLAGDVIVIVGDVLDSSDRLSRRAMDEFLRRDLSQPSDGESKSAKLLDHLRSARSTSGKAYEILAGLPFSTVVSLHPDVLLEQALHAYRAVILDEDERVAELAVGKRDLYLLGGSVMFGRGLILDQNDRDDFRERYQRLYQGFRAALAMAPVLFLGCDLLDWSIKRILVDILRHRTPLDGKLFSAGHREDWPAVSPGRTTIIEMTPEALLRALDDAVAGRRPMRMRSWVDRIPAHSGFRYLDHYHEIDRDIFFAREDDGEALLRVVLSSQSKTSVLCGRSGAGKPRWFWRACSPCCTAGPPCASSISAVRPTRSACSTVHCRTS